MAPAPHTSQKNKSVPASAGHRRASRNTPAFTIVAECKYADTGVGAAIACGSQKWNGNCALFVSTPSRISSSIAGYHGCERTVSPAASTTSKSKLPTMLPSTSTPSSSAKPPPTVTIAAMRAPRRASGRWYQYAISMNDVRPVSSQNTTSWIKLPESTVPSMAPMNAMRNEKKRGTGSFGDM